MKKNRLLTYAQAIQETLDIAMRRNKKVFVIGEGVPDPKHIFGTTAKLQEKYGSERVFDMPVSENALTGICIGAAISGFRPVLTHQRVDFSLLSLDQIINNAAKWYFMFGGQVAVPLVIRMIIGRGWGQGAQHSQSLQALFAHIPGLKVMMPTTAYDVKGMLLTAIEDNNPVISLEHRWLFNLQDDVPRGAYFLPLGKSRVLRRGKDITVVATSYAAIESLAVAKTLKARGISVEVIDPLTLRPLDDQTIIKSVKKTGRILVVDTGWVSGGISAEIISRVTEKAFSYLKMPPQRLGLLEIPSPSAPALTKSYYPSKYTIAQAILTLVKRKVTITEAMFQNMDVPHDVPDNSFTGPF